MRAALEQTREDKLEAHHVCVQVPIPSKLAPHALALGHLQGLLGRSVLASILHQDYQVEPSGPRVAGDLMFVLLIPVAA